MLTTVQDRGRPGYQKYGVPVSGAMDSRALRVANRLAGNDEDAAGLEMTFQGPELRFPDGAVLALAGAEFPATLDGRAVPRWRTFVAPPGSSLDCGTARDGLRAYLAIAGGIDVPVLLGSRSTFMRSGFGGFEGRRLQAGDRLTACEVAGGAPPMLVVPRARIPVFGHDHRLRVVLGPQDDGFTDEGIETFLSSTYVLTPESDRIGCRFAGPPVAHRTGADIVSDGIVWGSVQVSGDRMPIVLMADCGTTGGYTKIATVIGADLARLAQAVPGDRVRFDRVGLAAAVDALRDEERFVATLGAEGGAPEVRTSEPIYDEDSAAPFVAESLGELADALRRTRERRRIPPGTKP